jgi:hypothetical protein
MGKVNDATYGAGGCIPLARQSVFDPSCCLASVWTQRLIDSAGTMLAVRKQADRLPVTSDSTIISGTLTSREQSSAAAFRACFACLGRFPYLTTIVPAT